MGNEEGARQQDITDLKDSVSVVHQRIDRSDSQNRDDFQRLYDKTDAMNRSIQDVAIELQKMASQIAVNEQKGKSAYSEIKRIEDDMSELENSLGTLDEAYEKVLGKWKAENIDPINSEIRTWKKRFSIAVGILFLKMVGIIWYFVTRSDSKDVIDAINDVSN